MCLYVVIMTIVCLTVLTALNIASHSDDVPFTLQLAIPQGVASSLLPPYYCAQQNLRKANSPLTILLHEHFPLVMNNMTSWQAFYQPLYAGTSQYSCPPDTRQAPAIVDFTSQELVAIVGNGDWIIVQSVKKREHSIIVYVTDGRDERQGGITNPYAPFVLISIEKTDLPVKVLDSRSPFG